MDKVFEITNFFDNARWVNDSNPINFSNHIFDADDKLLIHWICYIVDRQMPFEKIWERGGFVFSDLVYAYKHESNLEILNPNYSNSFFIKDPKDSSKYTFISNQKVGSNTTLLKEYKEDYKVIFKSRFVPSDYICIFYTLHALQSFEYKLSNYIAKILKNIGDDEKVVKKLLFPLYLLTYSDVGLPNSAAIMFNTVNKMAEDHTEKLQDIIDDKSKFNKMFEAFEKNKIFENKRAWCSLRDFIKSPVDIIDFKEAMKATGSNDFDILFTDISLMQFELPGDVWNNNPTFFDCVFEKYKNSKSKSMPFNKFLRQIYESEKPSIGYPEQFDITFEFVPRMCEKTNCDVCPYKVVRDEVDKSEFLKVCINDKSCTKYCPVLLYSCGYRKICDGDHCELIKLISI